MKITDQVIPPRNRKHYIREGYQSSKPNKLRSCPLSLRKVDIDPKKLKSIIHSMVNRPTDSRMTQPTESLEQSTGDKLRRNCCTPVIECTRQSVNDRTQHSRDERLDCYCTSRNIQTETPFEHRRTLPLRCQTWKQPQSKQSAIVEEIRGGSLLLHTRHWSSPANLVGEPAMTMIMGSYVMFRTQPVR